MYGLLATKINGSINSDSINFCQYLHSGIYTIFLYSIFIGILHNRSPIFVCINHITVLSNSEIFEILQLKALTEILQAIIPRFIRFRQMHRFIKTHSH
jgi:hypothetical protein